MTLRYASACAALLAAVALDACGGGGSGSALPNTAPAAQPTPAPPGPTPSATPQVTQSFQITIPAASTSSTTRRARFVSPNTGSIRIAVQSVNGQPASLAPTLAKIGSGAAGCTGSGASTSLVCTVSATAAVGIDVFSITTYQSGDGSGAALAATTVSETVSTGSAGTAVPLSLGGLAAKIAFSPAYLPLVGDGQIHRYPVTIDAVDASGATIVGADPYQSGIFLQIENDPTHALSLSTASVTQPGTIVTVTFDASRSLVHGTIAASGTSLPAAQLDAAPLTVSPLPVFLYDDQTSGTAVTLTESGFTGTFSAAVANAQDAAATLAGGPLQTGSAVASIVPHTTFDVTTLNVGNGIFSYAVPLTIAPHPGSYTAFGNAHQLKSPASLIEGPDGKLWTADSGNGTLVSFDTASGTYASYTVGSPGAGPFAIAFDSAGNIWFANGANVGKFTPGSASVTMYSTGLQSAAKVLAIAAGAPGSMWFYDAGTNNPPLAIGRPSYFGRIDTASGSIQEFPTGNKAGPLQGPMSMTLGKDGAIWFADGYNGSVGRLDPSGTISETAVSTPAYPQQAPSVVASGPDGAVWFTSTYNTGGQSILGSIDPGSRQVQLVSGGLVGGVFLTLVAGSDNNLWFTEDEVGAIGYSSTITVGVVNPRTRVVYQYPAITPQFSTVTGMVDRGDRTLWMLDASYGQIGKVTFK